MNTQHYRLYYVYDPMCAWCWGYKPTWQQIEASFQDKLDIVYVVGGLAPDSDIAMPGQMQAQIASYWNKITSLLGTEFNHDFWSMNTPRRSTYPSCRAMLAARRQGRELQMLTAVQHAYYLQAKNPSDMSVLVALADDIGLDVAKFCSDIESNEINEALISEISFARSIGGNSFPSLFVVGQDSVTPIAIDYKDAKLTCAQIAAVMAN
ncbi:thioredoxin [Vibrio sp. UCD-FRSSP16_10]|uniref:DsbA family protein n=1 Tax=unclassified Vibrio TaxID=2614977 RepID=UPI00080054D6|nr:MULTISPECIES: DsbA family protein [unclassified Vibrio]OBT13857.1 thioredoxin [Vibrio sp. UCD-FRSSP16_30]OBT22738.1 thioredoxin [Vibrio sp. UCD-FRSSP16_10]